MGCACLFALIAAGAPRLALVLIWLFTNWIGRTFDSFVVPLLGFIFLPLTTVIYILVSPGGLTPIELIFVVVGVILDLGSYGGGAFGRRRRR